jgi:glycosyltransferase involved in cell wall biosynthesis
MSQKPNQSQPKELILFVISSLDFGGAQKILLWLANRLVVDGHMVKIITLSEPSEPAFFVDSQIEVSHLGLLSNSRTKLQSVAASFQRIRVLRRTIRSIQPTRIVSFMDRMNILVLLATIGLRIPVIVSERSHPSKNLSSTILNGLRRLFYPLARAIVFQTSGARSYFPWISPHRAKIIPNPAELGAPVERISTPPYTVIGVGRLSREKGFDLLVRAFAKIAKQFPDWRLCIYGDGPERSHLQALAQSLRVDLELPGWQESSRALSRATLFVLPSHYEGFPNALLEAMSARVAVVSSDCEFGPREILKHGESGGLFQAGDQESLETQLIKMMSNEKLRSELADRALQSLDRYSAEKVFADWKRALELRPKKVVFLIRSLALGGAERQLINLVNHLDPARVEPVVVTFYPGGTLEKSLKPTIQRISLNKSGRWSNLSFLLNLRSLINEIKPDVVYSFLTSSNIFVSVLRSLGSSFKVVWGVRSTTMDLKRFGVVAQIEGMVEDILKRSPDLIICNAEAARQYRLGRGYKQARLKVVANGIDNRSFYVDAERGRSLRESLGLNPKHTVIGMVARFDPMKGYEVFLEAASRAVTLNPNLRLMTLGSGSETYERHLKEMSKRLQLDDRLLWVKGIPLNDFYNAIDVFTLSSLGEAFPNVLAEAMSCGRPCVATDVGDSALIVGDFGIIVPPGDPHALASAWITLGERRSQWDPHQISDSIKSRFGLERYAEETCQALQQLN